MTQNSYMVDLAPTLVAPSRAARDERSSGAAPADYRADDLFAQALRDDSNRELDWLWVYVQVADAGQRRYCLDRALAISPKSDLALRELAKLTHKPAR